MMTIDTLIKMVEAMDVPSRELDAHLDVFFCAPDMIANDDGPGTLGLYLDGIKSSSHVAREYTSSLDDAVTLVPKGWWWTLGLCGVSGDASIGPDYNGTHRERLLAEFPPEEWDGVFNEDLRPGNGNHRACQAMLLCILRARKKMLEQGI